MTSLGALARRVPHRDQLRILAAIANGHVTRDPNGRLWRQDGDTGHHPETAHRWRRSQVAAHLIADLAHRGWVAVGEDGSPAATEAGRAELARLDATRPRQPTPQGETR